MNMQRPRQASEVGIVTSRQVISPQGRAPHVKARLTLDDGRDLVAIWWDDYKAPLEGTRVSVKGEVRLYKDVEELHVRETVVERQLPEHPLARVIGYYLECIEAEAASELSVAAKGSGYLDLSGFTPLMFGDHEVPVPDNAHGKRWATERKTSIGETIIVGYPTVVGPDPSGGAGRVAMPLFVGEASLLGSASSGFALRRAAPSVDINPAALDLLGIDREERDQCLLGLDQSVEFDEARSAQSRVEAGLRVLADVLDAPGLRADAFDLSRATPVDPRQDSIQNACIAVSTTGGSQFTRRLVEELTQLMGRPDQLAKGPLGVLLGAVAPEPVGSPRCYPIVLPTTLRQDQAMHAAMTNAFSVVTGPPGTGKSQVLVNVVAAAVAANQTVLFASKNNKAVDVVLERLRTESPNSTPLRAGSANVRKELAESLGRALDQAASPVDLTGPTAQQAIVERDVNAVLSRLDERHVIEESIREAEAKMMALRQSLPSAVDLSVDTEELRRAIAELETRCKAFGGPLPFWRRNKRWTIHEERLSAAQNAAAELQAHIRRASLTTLDVESALAPVASKPKRALVTIEGLSSLKSALDAVDEIGAIKTYVASEIERLERDFQNWSIEDALHDLSDRRVAAGKVLLAACWRHRVQRHPDAANHARQMREDLLAEHNSGAARAHSRGALPAFPAWGVTNLSAGTNFPLESELFDLVVIDEASQCDVASAIPLL